MNPEEARILFGAGRARPVAGGGWQTKDETGGLAGGTGNWTTVSPTEDKATLQDVTDMVALP